MLWPLRTLLIGIWVPLSGLEVELPVNADSLSWVSPEVEAEQFAAEPLV